MKVFKVRVSYLPSNFQYEREMFNGFVGFQFSQQKVKLICQRLRIIDNALTRDKLESLRMIGS